MSATNSLRPQHYFGAYGELSYCSRQAEEPDSKQLTDIASSSTADRDDDSRVMRQPEGSQRVGVHSKIHELPTKQPRTQRTVRPRRDGNTKRTVQQQRMELLRVERELEKLKLLMELRHLEQKITEGVNQVTLGPFRLLRNRRCRIISKNIMFRFQIRFRGNLHPKAI